MSLLPLLKDEDGTKSSEDVESKLIEIEALKLSSSSPPPPPPPRDEGFSKNRMVDPFPHVTGPFDRYWIDRADSQEFSFLCYCIAASSVVFIDVQNQKPVFIKTRCSYAFVEIAIPILVLRTGLIRTRVFFLSCNCLFHTDVSQLIRRLVEDPHVLKIGHKFKVEFSQLSFFLRLNGFEDLIKLIPFVDTACLYRYCVKKYVSLAESCEVLRADFESEKAYFKEGGGSFWFKYAANYAHSVLQMFFMFYEEVSKGKIYPCPDSAEIAHPRFEYCLFLNIIDRRDRLPQLLQFEFTSITLSLTTTIDIFEDPIAQRMRKYSEAIILSGFSEDNKSFNQVPVCSEYENFLEDWPISSPWNGYPKFLGKFLCDPTLIGLAKYLCYVGIDARALPSKKPTTREMLVTAHSDQRILLTRNKKLLKYKCLSSSQVHDIKEAYLEDQFFEVIQKFGLKICKSQLLSRCGICALKLVEGEVNGKVWNCPQCSFKRLKDDRYQHLIKKFTRLCNLDM